MKITIESNDLIKFKFDATLQVSIIHSDYYYKHYHNNLVLVCCHNQNKLSNVLILSTNALATIDLQHLQHFFFLPQNISKIKRGIFTRQKKTILPSDYTYASIKTPEKTLLKKQTKRTKTNKNKQKKQEKTKPKLILCFP